MPSTGAQACLWESNYLSKAGTVIQIQTHAPQDQKWRKKTKPNNKMKAAASPGPVVRRDYLETLATWLWRASSLPIFDSDAPLTLAYANSTLAKCPPKRGQSFLRQVILLPKNVMCCNRLFIYIVWLVIKNEVSGTTLPGFEFWLCYKWRILGESFHFSVLPLCKMSTVIVPTSKGC